MLLAQGSNGVAEWNRQRESVPTDCLQGKDLSGQDLGSVDLRSVSLIGVNFRHANLSRADLTGATGLDARALGGTNLSGAKLPEGLQFRETLRLADEAIKSARGVWLALLGACFYCLLTVGATTDANLVLELGSSNLPLIGVAVSYVRFYFVAPWILLGLFLYFHLYLQRLWNLVEALPARLPDGMRLDGALHPWLLTGIVRSRLPALRDEQVSWGRLQVTSSTVLAWGLVPLTIALMGWRTMVVANPFLSGTMAAVMLAALVAALSSWNGTGGGRMRTVAQLALWLVLVSLLGALVVGSALHWRLSSVEAWQVDLRSRSFPGVVLSGAKLGRAKLERADLRGAKLDRAVLRDAEMEGIELWESDLSGALLHRVKADYAKLADATVTHAYFDYASLRQALLRGVKGQHTSFVGADLSSAWLKKARLERANFLTARLRSAELTEAFLPRAILCRADLTSADLPRATLDGGVLVDAKLPGAHLREAKLRRVRLDRADLGGADLRGADLTGARLSGASLVGADLTDAVVEGALLDRTDLSHARLAGARGLTRAMLEQACGSGVTLEAERKTDLTACPSQFPQPPTCPEPQ